jgi:chromosome segregation ATPase
MKKTVFLSILMIACIVSGCASLDGSTQKDIQDMTAANIEMRKEVISLIAKSNEAEAKIAELERERNTLKANIADLERERNALKVEITASEHEKNTLKTEITTLAGENKTLKSSLALKEEKPAEKMIQREAETKAKAAEKLNAGFRIKVLTGTGQISSANNLAKRLNEMGYKVAKIDRAPRSNFSTDTVFYTQDAEKKAKEIAARIGKKTITKPITWPTDLDVDVDIIVVTGKQ